MPYKSKFDLTVWFNLKVPKEIGDVFVKEFGHEKWSEWARMCLQDCAKQILADKEAPEE